MMREIDEGRAVFVENGVTAQFVLSEDETVRHTDLAALREVWDEDVYHLNGLDLRDRWVIDLGAHLGAFAVRCALEGAKVIAVEPSPANVDRLTQHLVMNRVADRVHVEPRAVSGRGNEVRLSEWRESGMLAPDENGILYSGVSLRWLCDDHGITEAAVLKVDIEGTEAEVISMAGADVTGTFDRIEIEAHPMTHVDAGSLLAGLLLTHNTNWFGSIDRGGMISARRY